MWRRVSSQVSPMTSCTRSCVATRSDSSVWSRATDDSALGRRASVEMLLPVVRHTPARPWNRLVDRVMLRRRQPRPLVVVVGVVVPIPVLARLEALHERMTGVLGVLGGVLGRRLITAADVPALGTAPEMEPPAVGGQALDAASAARRHRGVDGTCVCHRHSRSYWADRSKCC